MKIDSLQNFRVEFAQLCTGGNFFDIGQVEDYHGYSARIYTLDQFSYCAVIEKSGDTAFKHEILFFPSNAWFKDWLGSQEPKPKVICEFGSSEPRV